MEIKKRIRTKGFWLSLSAAIVLLLQALGVKADLPYVNELIEAACTAAIALGLLTGPKDDGNIPPGENDASGEVATPKE